MYFFFTPNHSQKPHLQPILTQMESRGLKANHLNQTHRNKKKTKNLNPNPPPPKKNQDICIPRSFQFSPCFPPLFTPIEPILSIATTKD